MSSSLLEAEGSGQQYVTSTFGGTEFQVPLDVDTWPLDTIRGCRRFDPAISQLVVDHFSVATALRGVLGPVQWDRFEVAAPCGDDLVRASDVFAAAVGIERRDIPGDMAFGAVPRLLAVLERWPDKVESDLDQFWGIDYRDRWRFDGDRRRLTLRQIHVRLSNLPIDSTVAVALNAGRMHHTNTDLLLMDVWEALSGFTRRHPSRPMSAEERAVRDAQVAQEEKARADHHARQAKRADRLKSDGLESARANALIAQR